MRIEMSEARPIHDWQGWSGSLLALGDGTILMFGGDYSLRSHDAGQNWSRGPAVAGPTVLLHDGSMQCLMNPSEPVGEAPWSKFRTKRSISYDGWKTVEEPIDTTVEIPDVRSMFGDDYQWHPPSFERGVELETGTLLHAMMCNFAGDGGKVVGFEGGIPYRTIVVGSTDHGKSYQYVSTVAYDAETGQESFCEPSLLHLGGGDILCIMRTGRYAPMHQARSLDGGKTWSQPQSARVLGLAPCLTSLPNGVIVCSYGWRPMRGDQEGSYGQALLDYHRRYKAEIGLEEPDGMEAGNYVMFSMDHGQTWVNHTKIADPLTTGYTSVCAIDDDRALVVYARWGRTPFAWPEANILPGFDIAQPGEPEVMSKTITVRSDV